MPSRGDRHGAALSVAGEMSLHCSSPCAMYQSAISSPVATQTPECESDVAERPLKVTDAMRLPHDVRMQRDAHDQRAIRGLRVNAVEVVDDHLGEFRRLDRVAVGHRVVDIHLVRDRDQAAAAHAHRERLIVVVPVAVIFDAGLGHEVGRVVREGRRGREPSRELAAGVPAIGLDALLDRGALGVLRHVPVIARVVEAVRHHVPLAALVRFQDLRIVVEHREIERGGAADAEVVHDVEHAPEADAVAVVAQAVAQHVGMWRARPRIARPRFGQILVVLDVRHDPDGKACAAGPGKVSAASRSANRGRDPRWRGLVALITHSS